MFETAIENIATPWLEENQIFVKQVLSQIDKISTRMNPYRRPATPDRARRELG